MKKMNIKIAIDGHSSCGKSTMAKALAKHFGFVFVDTGAMYRSVTLFAIRNNMIDSNKNVDSQSLEQKIKSIRINFRKMDDGSLHTCLDGEDVEKEIRSMGVSSLVSTISALKFVRQEMVNQQRKIAEETSVVMDGRDIGTVVFPNAELKIFVTARPEVRAQRRYDEMQAKGDTSVTFNEVLENLKQRDLQDSTRAESPLKKADDAILLDNSDLTREQQFDMAVEMVEKIIK
ncbi:MAG: (d)CMP kinase [Bacteroidales bacterium]|nr:(d)CMP kinase [Bacteroidales bacterium]